MKKGALLLMAAALLVAISSCKKTAETIQSAEDNSQIETEYAQIYEVVSDYVSQDSRTAKTDDYQLPTGAVIAFSDTTFDDGDGIDFTIDYGPLDHGDTVRGTLCRDGRYRAGVVHVGIDKHWNDFPSTVTVAISSADNYYTGNGAKMYKLTGTKTITHTGTGTYTVNVSNATLQRDNGTMSWNAQRTITLTYDSPTGWLNDEYEVSGNASGINADGEAFTVQTVTPLQKRLSYGCLSTFVAGQLKLTTASGKELDIDYDPYGDQACDKTARVKLNNKYYTITLW